MAKTIRRLGRGLDSLVSNRPVYAAVSAEPTGQGATTATVTRDRPKTADENVPERTMIHVDSLRPNPFQPRVSITASDVVSLANSLKRSGFIQPITARRSDGGYQIIAGERRWLAAKSIGMSHVPVMVRQAGDAEMIELALIENIQREDLNAIERATAYQRFCEEFALTADEVARRVGEDRSTVVNYIRLLDLSPDVRVMVADGSLAMGHARCLLGVPENDRRLQLARACVRNQLSVRALEEIVRREKKRAGDGRLDAAPPRRDKSPHVMDMQRRFEERLKTKVVIEEGKRKGTGRIVIEYYTLDDFDRIREALGIEGD